MFTRIFEKQNKIRALVKTFIPKMIKCAINGLKIVIEVEEIFNNALIMLFKSVIATIDYCKLHNVSRASASGRSPAARFIRDRF